MVFFSLQNNILLFIFLILLTYFSIYESFKIFDNIFKNNNFLKFLLICSSVLYISFFSTSIWIYLNSNNIKDLASSIFEKDRGEINLPQNLKLIWDKDYIYIKRINDRKKCIWLRS